MSNVDELCKRINTSLRIGDDYDYFTLLKDIILKESDVKCNITHFDSINGFIQNIIEEVNELMNVINTANILISVKNQKILRTCYQVVINVGISNSLIPGLGLRLRLDKLDNFLPQLRLTDEEKYKILVQCTDFLHKSYQVPILKNIILTFHLSDYLAALIQLAFAPLKKPGVYENFVMTNEKYIILNTERKMYIEIYEHLVKNCFQPLLMKELLVLQNVKEVNPPMFVKRTVAKEMSRRLISPGGLLSLIRCFIESHNIDTGVEWRKIDMICKIICNKHGNVTETEYLKNICSQLKQIFSLNNADYLTTASSCLVSLFGRYPENYDVNCLLKDILQAFDYESIISQPCDPGTIVLTSQEVNQKVLILHACVCNTKSDVPFRILSINLKLLLALLMKCSSNNMKVKLNDIILKILEKIDKEEIYKTVNEVIYDKSRPLHLIVEEYNMGLILKCAKDVNIPMEEKISILMDLFKNSESKIVTEHLFTSFLQLLIDQLESKRNQSLLMLEKDPILLTEQHEKYAGILLLLSEASSTQKATKMLKTNPSIAIDFVENLLIIDKVSDECVTIALALLNSVLTSNEEFGHRLIHLIPTIEKLSMRNNDNSILCQELLSSIKSFPKSDSAYDKALSNVFDELLPVRAHGIMELRKLIDAGDTETISKRHYLFCLFQEQLKDLDSYVYLSAINGIASLASHCTEDVLGVLCKEFLQVSTENIEMSENNKADLRMKIGDIVVKVTKQLGELAIKHKTILLNTFLCGCRDEDPLIRASALSNLAEIALVLHYRIGTIIYEILICIWSIIESDDAIECRRAAVMVISSLLKGLGRDTLIELKENLVPIYRGLNKLYKNENEDSIVRLHSQIALEELNDIVKEFLFAQIPMQRDMRISELNEIKFK
ncbi:transport and Golgi organization protein 6 [Pieris rapae]|uniref:transport and Golgi organization protein 6 n=1 Tax=Pieris rapae TaxID=64459 RepID=UPI001E27D2FD|nr:transport and Golgi organization protein 6 [Pieris rapae]